MYEKNFYSGGRLSLIEANGHRFDQGPSLYLMPKLFEETFSDLGEKVADHLDLLQCEKNYTVYFSDGDRCELSCNFAKLYNQIKRYEGDDEKTLTKFLNFMKESHVHYERSIEIALKHNYEHWYDEFQIKHIPNIFRLHLWRTVYDSARKFFNSEKMRQVFTFQTMYIGMSPFNTPAMFNLLQYSEIVEGIWYVRGGFHKVIEALEKIATQKYGAKFHYGTNIKKIIVDEKNVAKGVQFDDGREEYADIVVCNADVVYAYNQLLPSTKYGKELGEKAALTSSSISFYWGLSRQVPELDVHNIFLAKDYKSSFENIFKQQILSDDPFFYVNVPSRIDESAAPKGKDTVILLLPISHISTNNQDCMDEWVARARRIVINILEERLGIHFESLIETEIINDPRNWQSKFNLWKGAILGLSHCIPQVLHYRPSIRSKHFQNLYFVGASTHPGK